MDDRKVLEFCFAVLNSEDFGRKQPSKIHVDIQFIA
jgi:hypothetical protein